MEVAFPYLYMQPRAGVFRPDTERFCSQAPKLFHMGSLLIVEFTKEIHLLFSCDLVANLLVCKRKVVVVFILIALECDGFLNNVIAA